MSSQTQPATLPAVISFLETTNDPAVAFFSYSVDESGEYGVIRANKEGLRLYALDLLKKSMQMEEVQNGKKICFEQQEWLISETNYHLIEAVQPEYTDRRTIFASRYPFWPPEHKESLPQPDAPKGWRRMWHLLTGSF